MRITQFCLAILAPLAPARAADVAVLLDKYCLECHDNEVKKGGLSLERRR